MLENRLVQLAFMVLSTVTLSNMQYGWTLFVNPMRNENHWATVGIQLAFSILIFLNTWLAPLEGWFADRYGRAWRWPHSQPVQRADVRTGALRSVPDGEAHLRSRSGGQEDFAHDPCGKVP